MSKTIKISMILSILLLTAINFSQFDHSQIGDTKLTTLFNLAIAEDGEGGSGCCVARSTDEHCGMKLDYDSQGACCKSSTACDKCILTNYRTCSN